MRSLILNIRNRHFLLLDVNAFFLSLIIAMLIRFDGKPDWQLYGRSIFYFFVIFSLIKLTVFYVQDLYRRYWRLASIDELLRLIIITAYVLSAEIFCTGILKSTGLKAFIMLPYSIPLLDGIITMFFVSSLRFSVRFTERIIQRNGCLGRNKENILIAGAGMAGTMIALEMQGNSQLRMNPVAFVDDDQNKYKMKIRGIPVAGNCMKIPEVVREYKIKKVIIAMPTASGSKIREIVNDCTALGVETLTVPGIFEILNGRITIDKVRKIEISDLLRREPVMTDIERVRKLIRGKKVLITGAGGSIGSELCRQVLRCNPSDLMLLGHGENSIFEIEQELNDREIQYLKAGEMFSTKIHAGIADLRFKGRLKKMFEKFQPEIIFHAAAHKHVPLMENNPQEAVSNNILGTRNLVQLAVRFNVQHFISISTDKAVNPTSIMGASKRITEMIILDAAKKTGRCYSAVRFGNVLGSRGSVVRTFQKQILAGGPITITHPDIIRYFMTIQEAVQLVLQASVLGTGGDVFVLDMGKPVKIIDMAKDIIRLAGLKEGEDINIMITGLRPGEKLYEELSVPGEKYEKTAHEKIMIARNASTIIPDELDEVLGSLLYEPENLTREDILQFFSELIPEFQPDEITKESLKIVS